MKKSETLLTVLMALLLAAPSLAYAQAVDRVITSLFDQTQLLPNFITAMCYIFGITGLGAGLFMLKGFGEDKNSIQRIAVTLLVGAALLGLPAAIEFAYSLTAADPGDEIVMAPTLGSNFGGIARQ